MLKTVENCINRMEKLSKEQGFDIFASKKVSNHPDDWYLRIVFCRYNNEYVTWLYNSTLGDNGSMNYGHYFTDFDSAHADFLERT